MTQEEVDKINEYYNNNPIEVNLDLEYDLNDTVDIKKIHKPLAYYYRLFEKVPYIPDALRRDFLLALAYYEREEYCLRFTK